MGNLHAESGLIPTNLQNTYEKKLGMTDFQYTAAVDKGTYSNFIKDKAGYGLAQWTYWSRKQNLLNFCRAKGKSIGDLNTQLDFLYKELTTSYPQVIKSLLSATSVQQASNVVLLQFEKPANQGIEIQQKRAKYGQMFYDKFASNKTIGGNKKMKYSDTNLPIQCMMTNSSCYKGTKKMKVKGILWHSTGANNPNIKRYVQPSDNDPKRAELLKVIGINSNRNDWNHKAVQAGLNCWIGKLADGTVATVQTMPWDYRPWGCGSGPKGSCNDGWIQFEICEDSLQDSNYFNAIYQEACEITAYLCKKYNIDPHGKVIHNRISVPTILCHIESNKLGLGSAHSDVLHWFPKFGKNMNTVRDNVAALLVDVKPAPILQDPPISTIIKEEDEDMTQEKFNELASNYFKQLAAKEGSAWSSADRNWGISKGLFNGDNKGNYSWRNYVTREQLAAVLHRLEETK